MISVVNSCGRRNCHAFMIMRMTRVIKPTSTKLLITKARAIVLSLVKAIDFTMCMQLARVDSVTTTFKYYTTASC